MDAPDTADDDAMSDSSEEDGNELTDAEMAAFSDARQYDVASDAPTAQLNNTADEVGCHIPAAYNSDLFNV
jgi:hypothetical protein